MSLLSKDIWSTSNDRSQKEEPLILREKEAEAAAYKLNPAAGIGSLNSLLCRKQQEQRVNHSGGGGSGDRSSSLKASQG